MANQILPVSQQTSLEKYDYRLWPGTTEFKQYCEILDAKKISEKAKRTMETSELPSRQPTTRQLADAIDSARFLNNMSISEYRASVRIEENAGPSTLTPVTNANINVT